MSMYGRSREASERFAERRRREDEAPRLREELPALKTLRLEVEEHRGTSAVAETKHVRIVIIDRAPALFIVPCGDSECREGGHDITGEVMDRLRQGIAEFVVEDKCFGNVRDVACGRIVRVLAAATYAAPSP
jgi:hypothetical protein